MMLLEGIVRGRPFDSLSYNRFFDVGAPEEIRVHIGLCSQRIGEIEGAEIVAVDAVDGLLDRPARSVRVRKPAAGGMVSARLVVL